MGSPRSPITCSTGLFLRHSWTPSRGRATPSSSSPSISSTPSTTCTSSQPASTCQAHHHLRISRLSSMARERATCPSGKRRSFISRVKRSWNQTRRKTICSSMSPRIPRQLKSIPRLTRNKHRKDAEAMQTPQVMKKGDMSAEEAQRLKARKQAANAKLKKELEQEQEELARTLMTNRQRKLYRKAEDEQKSKKVETQKLKVKRK